MGEGGQRAIDRGRGGGGEGRGMAMRVLNYVNGKRIEIKFQDPSEKRKKTGQSKKKLESDE